MIGKDSPQGNQLNRHDQQHKHKSAHQKIDWDWIDKQKSKTDLKFVRHIELKNPLTVRIDAQKREGIILKPEE